MDNGTHTLAAAVHSDLLIRKSRFIGCVQPIADRAAAQAAVDGLRVAHPGAAHVCWAMLAGGQSAAVDDGEPGGTAGRPMLEVLRHQDLDGVLATVVRYFGGIKLGAGGLLRAYTEAVAQALRDAAKVPLQRMQALRAVVAYDLEGMVRREAALAGATLLQVAHGSLVEFQLSLPQGQAARFVERIDELSQGRVGWRA
jgi:uncharacterized YigZ family protein